MSALATVNHTRALGLCGRGCRPWFARVGLSWNTFVSEGYDSEVLRATGDPMAAKVAALAEAEAKGGG